MIVRRINEEEILEAKNIAAVCFEGSNNLDGRTLEEFIQDIKDNPKTKEDKFFMEKWAAFTDDNQMMSCFSVIPYVVNFDGNLCNMIGIGGVCTYPVFRRGGAVKQCFLKALPEMYENGNDFTYLYAFSESFYGRFGYERSSTSVEWSFALNGIPDYTYDGSFVMYKEDSKEEFMEAYHGMLCQCNLMVERDEIDWSHLDASKPFDNGTFAFLYKDVNQIPRGYFVFKKVKEGHDVYLECSEMIFDSYKTLKALTAFVKTYSSDYTKIRFSAPNYYKLEKLCKDYQQFDSSYRFKTNGMVRVVNVESVLKKAIYKGSGELTIRIDDNQIEQNNGIYKVTFENGTCTSVIKLSSGTEDVRMTINIFSGAITGNYKVDDFDFMDDIYYNCDKDKLSKCFYEKPCWINNYF